MVVLLIAVFVASLLIAGGAAASFTRRLEIISDRLSFSAGLLSLLGALGANIPNYVASLAAAISGQVGVGIGIIVGSNIYNMAVILGISAFASPARQGMTLSHQEAQDARVVGGITLALMVLAGLAAGLFSWKVFPSTSHQAMLQAHIALLVLNLFTLGLLRHMRFDDKDQSRIFPHKASRNRLTPDSAHRLSVHGARGACSVKWSWLSVWLS